MTGSARVLCHGARVDLEDVHIAVVPGDHHVVPLVVVERLVGVALHQRRPVAQVKHVMDVAGEKKTGRHTHGSVLVHFISVKI